MKKRLLIVSVLSLMLVGALSAGSPTAAGRCGWENCVNMYNDCEASCGGVPVCIKRCQREYSECQCTNCGLCPLRDQPAAFNADALGVSADPGVTEAQPSTSEETRGPAVR
jgi:hypothetical protein